MLDYFTPKLLKKLNHIIDEIANQAELISYTFSLLEVIRHVLQMGPGPIFGGGDVCTKKSRRRGQLLFLGLF